MAEEVNKRMEDMINELEQLKRMEIYTPTEIREIARRRKEFEYELQRHTKCKEIFIKYIAYEMALLEDIALRRKQLKVTELKKDVEYTIARRVNVIFKQCIYRFQNDLEVYFQYIKYCECVGFASAISGIITQMLQVHGDKPKMWQMAAKWNQQNDEWEPSKQLLIKGIQKFPKCDFLYLDLFLTELMLAFKTKETDLKEKLIKRAEVVWKNGMQNLNSLEYLFQIYKYCLRFDFISELTQSVKNEIFSRRNEKDVWAFIALEELMDNHWEEIDSVVQTESTFPTALGNYIAIYEHALQEYPDEKMFTKYIRELLGVGDSVCTEHQKIKAVKRAWMFGHEHNVLPDDLYEFGIQMLKMEDDVSDDELMKILDVALENKPSLFYLWKEKMLLHKDDDNKMYEVVKQARKVINDKDMVQLYNLLLDNAAPPYNNLMRDILDKMDNCESIVYLTIKPKLLSRTYDSRGLKAARDMYNKFLSTPPLQIDIHKTMIDIESKQEKKSYKHIKKYYECMVQNHGRTNCEIWLDYIKFENENHNGIDSSSIYRRAQAVLDKDLIGQFVKEHTLSRLQ